MSRPAPPVDRRLDLVLTANAALEALVAVSVLAVYVTLVRSGWVLLILSVVCTYCAAVLHARRLARRGRTTEAVVWAAAGYVPVSVVCAVVAPFSLPLLVIAALMPTLFAVPYLSSRGLSLLTAASFGLSLLSTVVATFTPVEVIEDRVSDTLAATILVLGVPAIAALLVLVAWQSHVGMVATAEEIRRSEERLDRARLEEQRRVERRLEATVTGHLDRAGQLVGSAAGSLATDTAAADAALTAAAEALQAANADLRALAAGLHPAVLTGQGLVPAVESLAARGRVPVTVHAPAERLPMPVEQAVYRCVAAVLEAVPPGRGAAEVWVHVGDRDVAVTVTVTSATGGRIRGMADGVRLAVDRALALDGTASVPAAGTGRTVVELTLPLGPQWVLAPLAGDADEEWCQHP